MARPRAPSSQEGSTTRRAWPTVRFIVEEFDNIPDTLPDGVANQHRHLAAQIRRLRRAHESGQPWEDLARLLDALIEDVKGHFTSEEEAMEQGGYPRLADHQHQHRLFVRRLHALREEC